MSTLFSRRTIRDTPPLVRENAVVVPPAASPWNVAASSWQLFRTTAKKYDDEVDPSNDDDAALSMTDDSSSDEGSQNREDDAGPRSFWDRLEDTRYQRCAQDEEPQSPAMSTMAVYTEMDLNLVLLDDDVTGNQASMARSSLLTQGKQRVLRSTQRLTDGSRKLKKE